MFSDTKTLLFILICDKAIAVRLTQEAVSFNSIIVKYWQMKSFMMGERKGAGGAQKQQERPRAATG